MNLPFMRQRKTDSSADKKPLSVSRSDGTRVVNLKDAVKRQRDAKKFESYEKVKIFTPS